MGRAVDGGPVEGVEAAGSVDEVPDASDVTQRAIHIEDHCVSEL
jgi:hypothetical protein